MLYTFPFEGNWNTRQTLRPASVRLHTCYTLSRLKGIETARINRMRPAIAHHLLYTFPFEGNWNFKVYIYTIRPIICALLYTFPFEGNWNEIVFRQRDGFNLLAIHFPVWRELKHQRQARTEQAISGLLYTFPFEGNWNPNRYRNGNTLKAACYTLSRLKGIETQHISISQNNRGKTCYTLSRLKGIETQKLIRFGSMS